jgi:DNA-binding SARP family transcriptional activator
MLRKVNRASAHSLDGDSGHATLPDAEAAVGLLGPICIYGRRGPVPIRGEKQQLLLALLALSPGRTVSIDRLTDALWGEAPPATAQTALRVHIARLRELLSEVPTQTPQVVYRPPGYALDLDSGRIDSVRFARLLSVATESDARQTLVRLDKALSLWRGEPYGGLSDNELLRIEGRRLSELYEAALEDRAEAMLRLGEHPAAISDLEGLVRAEPLRERRSLLLMIALYRGGRQAEALDVYRNLRRVLADELGIAPSPELQDMQRAVLAHDTSSLELIPPESASSLVVSQAAKLPWWLETTLSTTMFGRDRLLDELVERVEEKGPLNTDSPGVHVLLLSGEAGVGKSRLLAELTRRMTSRGVRILAGWCDPEGIIPFRPLTEAFRDLVGERAVDVWPSPVTKAAARIARYFTGPAEDQQHADPETDRLRYFEGVANLLHVAAEHYRLLLAIDDIQWLDPSSAALLRYVLHQPVPHPVVLVACYRTDRQSTRPPGFEPSTSRKGCQLARWLRCPNSRQTQPSTSSQTSRRRWVPTPWTHSPRRSFRSPVAIRSLSVRSRCKWPFREAETTRPATFRYLRRCLLPSASALEGSVQIPAMSSTRPPRWGKTSTSRMLRWWPDVRPQVRSRRLTRQVLLASFTKCRTSSTGSPFVTLACPRRERICCTGLAVQRGGQSPNSRR